MVNHEEIDGACIPITESHLNVLSNLFSLATSLFDNIFPWLSSSPSFDFIFYLALFMLLVVMGCKTTAVSIGDISFCPLLSFYYSQIFLRTGSNATSGSSAYLFTTFRY